MRYRTFEKIYDFISAGARFLFLGGLVAGPLVGLALLAEEPQKPSQPSLLWEMMEEYAAESFETDLPLEGKISLADYATGKYLKPKTEEAKKAFEKLSPFKISIPPELEE